MQREKQAFELSVPVTWSSALLVCAMHIQIGTRTHCVAQPATLVGLGRRCLQSPLALCECMPRGQDLNHF